MNTITPGRGDVASGILKAFNSVKQTFGGGGARVDEALLTKQSWGCGLLIAGLQMLAVVLACYLRLVVELFRRREYVIGVLFAVLFLLVGGGWTLGVLAGLPVGWRYARRWGLRPWMAVWSLALVGGLANIAAGGWLLKMTATEWREWFGWVPSF